MIFAALPGNRVNWFKCHLVATRIIFSFYRVLPAWSGSKCRALAHKRARHCSERAKLRVVCPSQVECKCLHSVHIQKRLQRRRRFDRLVVLGRAEFSSVRVTVRLYLCDDVQHRIFIQEWYVCVFMFSLHSLSSLFIRSATPAAPAPDIISITLSLTHSQFSSFPFLLIYSLLTSSNYHFYCNHNL